MALKITITDAGRAELINADKTGTGPVEITHVAFTETTFSPSKTLKALPDEIKRLSSIAGEVVADDTISVTAKDEGTDAYTVRGFGLISEYGTLFAVYSQEAPIIEKSGPTTLLLTTDIILADLPTASLTFGDISFSNPPASTSTPGVVRLSNATDSTARNLAATPHAVKLANDNANTRLIKSQNLADLPSPSQARSNLGLGASATMGTTVSRTSTSTSTVLQAKAMNDHRQSDDHDGRYTRPNVENTWTSPQRLRSTLYMEGPNGAYSRTNARDEGTSTRIHSYSTNRDGKNSPFLQAWYGESSYTNVTTTNAGVEFDKEITSTGFNLPSGVSLKGVTNGLEINRPSGSVEIGNRNSSYTHYTSSAGKHYFYGQLHTQSGFYGDGSGLTGTASLRATGTTKADVGLSKVPNLDATDANTANTLMTRNSSGDTWARLFRSSYASTNANIAGLYTTQTIGGDYMRPSTPAQVMNAVGATRTIATGSGLSGGGNLSANRTLSVDSSVVRTSRAINTGSGLSGGGNLSGNRTLSVDSTVARTSQFSHSARPSGYTWIAGNILIQWGFLSFGNISSGGTHRRNVTFPIAFPNGAWQAITSLTSGLFVDGSSSVSAENLVLTGFTAVYAYPWNGGNINPSISWIAIGN